MRDVDVSAPEYLPDWAKTFMQLYENWWRHDGKIKAKWPGDKPYLMLTAVWAELCRPWLHARQQELESANIKLAKSSVDDLLEYVMLRLSGPLFGVLKAYPGSIPEGGDERWQLFQTPDFWQKAFDRQPILVKIIGNQVLHWRTSTREMLVRFAADLSQIRTSIFPAKADQAGEGIVVSRLLCGLGDPHRGGRSVAIFETNHGEVVYKPKDLVGTWAAGQLLQELHQAHRESVPLTPAFLYCNGYGWEQRVCQRECRELAEVETFYRRLGGWLYLLQLLNGNDFWYDNLIACADMPYFIDYETVVGNGFDDHWRKTPQNQHVEQFQKMSLVGILPLLMPGSVDPAATTDSIDISVTTPPGKQRVPFRKTNRSGTTNPGQIGDDDFFGSFEASDYAPFYRGEFQDMNAFLEFFIDGYKRMGHILQSDAGKESLQRFYGHIAKSRFRHIVVDTWQCYSLLAGFFNGCGNDGVRATIALDGYFASFRGYQCNVIEGIRNDIWNNDIPLFEFQANDLRIFNTANVAGEEKFFQKTALSKIKRNHAYLPDEGRRQVDNIKALFSTRPDHPRPPWPWRGKLTGASPPVTDEALAMLAQETGNQLASIINQAESLKDCLAISRTWLNNDRIPLPLPQNFDGCSGIIVFLAELLQSSAKNNAQIKALHKCRDYLTDTPEFYYAGKTSGNGGVISLTGAKLAALCRLARIQRFFDDDMTTNIEILMRGLLKDMHNTDRLFMDYRHGISGLLYRFKELELIFNTEKLTDWIEQILALIESKPLQMSPEQTDAYRKYADAFLPDGVSGMHLADHYIHANWRSFAAHPGYSKLRRFMKEQPEQGLHPAAAEPSPATGQMSKRHGEVLMDCIYRLLVKPGGDFPKTDINFPLNELIARKRNTQRWFPDCWEGDNFLLGAIYGQADMGLLLLSVLARKNLNPFRTPNQMFPGGPAAGKPDRGRRHRGCGGSDKSFAQDVV